MEHANQSPVPPANCYAKPQRHCDIVMKGGITSGVVYPLAVVNLAKSFSFKSIGGTSAGAIAAAAAAAAELGRNSRGFERLAELPKFLGDPGPDGKGSNLFAFFQPQPTTRKLFRILIAFLGGGPWVIVRVFKTAIIQFPVEALLGSVPALVLLLGACASADGIFFLVCLVAVLLLLIVGATIGIVLAILESVSSALPRNFFGLCTGMTDEFRDTEKHPAPSQQGKPLTYWLTEYLDELSGLKRKDQPLTFADLWDPLDEKGERNINLEMMTTCLTHGRPYRLPFRDDEEVKENGLFYFNPDEFRRLFPERVVRWMVENPRQTDDECRRERLKQRGFYPLPAPKDLPIVVAVRMSLSFPILLSAVPLYAINYRPAAENKKGNSKQEHPERCWFSDGGVCSNFPLHFFESPLPRWPTLSINLIAKPRGTNPPTLECPEMAKGNGDKTQEYWNRFDVDEEISDSGRLVRHEKSGLGKLAGFIGALITTMQNWSDNTQSRLPGYRDRIAHVGLTPEEGGLNLNMPKHRITDLTQRGAKVADEFISRFATPPGVPAPEMNWDNHRWLRMRSLLASLESMCDKLDRTCANPEGGDQEYQSWMATTSLDGAPGYNWNATQRDLALKTLAALRQLTSDWNQGGTPAAKGAPHPRPELRTRPQI